jgi:hypothetical protein
VRWRWLLLLPLAVALVLVASASRLHIYWWPADLRDETSGRQGEAVEMVDRWTDGKGEDRERRFAVTLVDVRRATWVEGYDGPEPVEAPSDVAVWRISLDFEVDPDVPLGGCAVSIVDTDGREARAVGGSVGEVRLPFTSCEPQNRQGPDYEGTRPEGVLPRLPTYRVAVYAIAAADAVPAAVRLWWEPTDYVEIDVNER